MNKVRINKRAKSVLKARTRTRQTVFLPHGGFPPKFVDGIIARAKPIPARTILAPVEGGASALRRIASALAVSKVSLVLLMFLFVIPLTAFEAHVVNVTATIERRPCVELSIRSKGFWREHPERWILPQTLGSMIIATPEDAEAVFSAPNTELNKLKKQMLALAFNISAYGLENALVPGENTTVGGLMADANDLLSEDPPAAPSILEAMKNRIEKVNTAGSLSTCPKECPKEDGDGDGDLFVILHGDGDICERNDDGKDNDSPGGGDSAPIISLQEPAAFESEGDGGHDEVLPEQEIASSTESTRETILQQDIALSLEAPTETEVLEIEETNVPEEVGLAPEDAPLTPDESVVETNVETVAEPLQDAPVSAEPDLPPVPAAPSETEPQAQEVPS